MQTYIFRLTGYWVNFHLSMLEIEIVGHQQHWYWHCKKSWHKNKKCIHSYAQHQTNDGAFGQIDGMANKSLVLFLQIYLIFERHLALMYIICFSFLLFIWGFFYIFKTEDVSVRIFAVFSFLTTQNRLTN